MSLSTQEFKIVYLIIKDQLTENWPLNRIPGAVIVYDSAGTVTGANDAACDLLGLSPKDLLGSEAEDSGWLMVEGAEGPISVHPATAAIKSRQAVRGVVARVHRPGVADIWLQVDALPEFSAGGEISQVVATLTDITHLIARSRLTDRNVGEHIVEEVTGRLAQSRLDPQAILQTVTSALSKLRPGIWIASLMSKDPNTMRVVAADEGDDFAARWIEAMQLSGEVTSTPISTKVIESGEPLLIPSISVDRLNEGLLNQEVRTYVETHPWSSEGTLGVLVVPMRARGTVIGTLGLFERRGSNPLTDKDTIWIQEIADRTGQAVENAQLFEDAVNRLERLSSLESVGLAVAASPDLRLTLKVLLEQVTSHLRVDAADVLLLDESDNTLGMAANTGFLSTAVLDYRLPVDEGLPGRAIAGRRIETVTALGAFSQFRRRSLFAREGFKSYGAVPLIARARLMGVLEVFHRSAIKPDQEWLSFLDSLGSVAAIAIDLAAMHDRIQRTPGGETTRKKGVPRPQLSPRETQILKFVVEGMTNREIAAEVHLSQDTVKFHVRQILEKTGATNRTDLAHQATREGWL